MKYTDWSAWRNDYYDRLQHQGRNAQRMATHARATADRPSKVAWAAGLSAAGVYYDSVIVPASAELGRQFDALRAQAVIDGAPDI